MAASTVTGNTSVVLVSSPQSKVFLSSVGYPGHIVTIKDVGGLASQGDPIVVSTTNGIFFADGSISTLLVDPFSYLTVSSKTPTTWQILNNIGYLTTLSNAYVDTLTVQNAFSKVVSSVQETVSSATIQTVNVTQSLELLGNVDILGDITVTGVVDLFSTLNVKEDIRFSSFVIAQGAVSLFSSLSIQDELIVGGNMSTLGTLTVGEDFYVGSSLYVRAALVPRFLSVQTLTMNTLNLGAGLQTAEGISVGCNTFLGGSFSSLSSLVSMSSITVLGNTTIQSSLQVRKNFETEKLISFSSGVVAQQTTVGRDLYVFGTFSTPNSLFIGGYLSTTSTIVSTVQVTGEVCTTSLLIGGNAEISSMILSGNLAITGNMSLIRDLTVKTLEVGDTGVGNTLSTGQTVDVNLNLSSLGDYFIRKQLDVGNSLVVKEETFLGTVETLDFSVYRTTSTTELEVNEDLLVLGDFSIPGTAFVNALGAPIGIVLSTLSLSNTMTTTTFAKIPSFTGIDSLALPNSFEVGEPTAFSGFLKASTVNVRSRIIDNNLFGDRKAISTAQISTLLGTNLLSTFLIGSSNFTNPLVDASGLLLLGSNINESNVYTFTTVDFRRVTNPLQFSSICYGASYSQANSLWVAVGQNSTSVGTLQYSTDKTRTWNPIVSGGFPESAAATPPYQLGGQGRDVLYMSTTYQNQTPPIWVATGQGVGMAQNTIQYSSDGSNWSVASGTLFSNAPSALGGKRLLLHRFTTNPNDGAIMIAGGNGGAGNFGIRYSSNGTDWYQSSATPSPFDFDCADITTGPVTDLWAVGTSGGSKTLIRCTECNYATNWSNVSSNLNFFINTLMTTFKTIAYGNNTYVIGGIPSGGNANYSIFYSTPSAANWQPIMANGFSGGCERIVFNSAFGAFFAVGSNASGNSIQISPNGQNWQPLPLTFPSALYGFSLSEGGIQAFDILNRYFVVNVPARFDSGISSVNVTTNVAYASSFTANTFAGNASLLTNLTNFGSNMYVSSIRAENVYFGSSFFTAASTLTSSFQTSEGFLYASDFLSTVNLTLGVGVDSRTQGNIQATNNGSIWNLSSNASFEYYGNDIVGNNNQFEPFFLATGADSQCNRTIQYSQNGRTWQPVTSGGFPNIIDADGNVTDRAEGLTVAIFYYMSGPTLVGPRYLVGGLGRTNTDSLLWSDDGLNFTPTFSYGNAGVQKIKTANIVAIAKNYSPGNIIWSSDGVSWNESYRSPTYTDTINLSAFGFGYFPTEFPPGIGGFGWWGFGLDPTNPSLGYNLYYSSDNGANWSYVANYGFFISPKDMVYAPAGDPNGYWLIVSDNSVVRANSVNSGTWNFRYNYEFPVERIQSAYYASNQSLWYLGAQSSNNLNTIFTSPNATIWSPIVSGGFSSGTVSIGAGYAVTTGFTSTIAVGTGAFSFLTPTKPQILDVISFYLGGFPAMYTNRLLTASNTSNVFRQNCYGVGVASTLGTFTYPYVVVGDGVTPQKTIARSSNLTDWIPAVTGGFSPAGYAVKEVYLSTLSSLWLATGKAVASTANIQYSEDTANWFATNYSASIPNGGRGIAQISSLYRTVIVGEGVFTDNAANSRKTIAYSDDAYTWTDIGPNAGFQEAGYGVAEGYVQGMGNTALLAVGSAKTASGTNDPAASILYSTDGISWSQIITSGGFDIAGYGIAYGRNAFYGSELWVAVGEHTNYTSNIQYSVDGLTWTGAGINAFRTAGYGVTYNQAQSVFIAVGESLSNTQTVLVSPDGSTWVTAGTSNSGFANQQVFGIGNAFYSQQLLSLERSPFLVFPKFTLYQRSIPFNYGLPSMRIQSTLATFNEALSVNFSSQTMINTYTPFQNYTVTVEGNVSVTTLVYKGDPLPEGRFLSTVTVSTLQVGTFLRATTIQTPSWGNISSLANKIEVTTENDKVLLYVNETLSITRPNPNSWGVGINTLQTLNSSYLQVNGTVAASSLTSAVYTVDTVEVSEPNKVFLNSCNLSIYSGANSHTVIGKNTIYSEVSTLTFNNALTINLSTQRVGIYTSNPLFDFDARTRGLFDTLRTQTVNAALINFTIQSI